MLAKIRHLVPANTMKVVYSTIFNSHLTYGCQVWAQNQNQNVDSVAALQDKALRIITFQTSQNQVEQSYYNLKILKLYDYLKFMNCLFVYDHQKNNLPNTLKTLSLQAMKYMTTILELLVTVSLQFLRKKQLSMV